MFLMKLRWLYWSFMLWRARQFRAGLEKTIASERRRAADAVEYAETMAARAKLELNLAVGRRTA